MKADKTVVLFAGCAGHGKDTAANILCAGLGGVKMAYADPLKTIVHELTGIPMEILYGTQEQKETYLAYGKSARHWLQYVGTEMGRNVVHPDVWVHRFADRIIASPDKLIINSDTRFLNEINVLRERLALDRVAGAIEVIAIRIINPRVPVNLTHRSESEIYHLKDDAFDFVLMNDGTIDDLQAKLRMFAEKHLVVKVDGPGSARV